MGCSCTRQIANMNVGRYQRGVQRAADQIDSELRQDHCDDKYFQTIASAEPERDDGLFGERDQLDGGGQRADRHRDAEDAPRDRLLLPGTPPPHAYTPRAGNHKSATGGGALRTCSVAVTVAAIATPRVHQNTWRSVTVVVNPLTIQNTSRGIQT